jgi:hypothetical protein
LQEGIKLDRELRQLREGQKSGSRAGKNLPQRKMEGTAEEALLAFGGKKIFDFSKPGFSAQGISIRRAAGAPP